MSIVFAETRRLFVEFPAVFLLVYARNSDQNILSPQNILITIPTKFESLLHFLILFHCPRLHPIARPCACYIASSLVYATTAYDKAKHKCEREIKDRDPTLSKRKKDKNTARSTAEHRFVDVLSVAVELSVIEPASMFEVPAMSPTVKDLFWRDRPRNRSTGPHGGRSCFCHWED